MVKSVTSPCQTEDMVIQRPGWEATENQHESENRKGCNNRVNQDWDAQHNKKLKPNSRVKIAEEMGDWKASSR